jgi:hypothetical protein
VKALMRGFGLAFLMACFLGLSGCGNDNESAAEKLQAKEGPVPTPVNKAADVPPPARNMEDYAKQQKKNMDYSNSDYAKQSKKK